MSNWFFNQLIKDQTSFPDNRKGLFAYFLISLLLAASGAWMIYLILSYQNTFPIMMNETALDHKPLSSAFTPSVNHWSDKIRAWSEAWNLDPLLVATVMQIESCGDPAAVSPAGAQGLFQVMPYHFEQNENTLDPEINALRGLAYLHQSNKLSNGNVELTLAGYNGGHGQIGRDKTLWPDETQRYAHWGSGIYYEAVSGENPSKTLTAWLEAGGWRLCQEAELTLGLD